MDLTKLSTEELLQLRDATPDTPPDAASATATASPEAPPSGVVRNLGLGTRATANGLVQGITGIPLMIGDAANAALNLPIRGMNAAFGTNIPQFGMPSRTTNEALDAGLDAIGLPKPATQDEKLIGAVVEGGASALSPAAAARKTIEAGGKAIGPLTRSTLDAFADAPVVQTISGATAGGAGELAQQADAGPVGTMAATLAGGIAPAVVAPTARTVVAAGREYAAPLTESGRKDIAARTMQRRAEDSGAAAAAIEAGERELVPGSVQTTGAISGDRGLAQLENTLQQSDRYTPRFNQRREQQNTARVGALRGVETEGDQMDAVSGFQQALADIDAEFDPLAQRLADDRAASDAQFDAMQGRRAGHIDATRGRVADDVAARQADVDAALDARDAAGQAGAARVAQVTQAGDDAVAGARQAADAGWEQAGRAADYETAGADIRAAAIERRQAARQRESELFDAIPRNMTVRTGEVTGGLARVQAQVTPSHPPITSAERMIHGVIEGYGDTVSFQELRGLRTWIGEAMRAERGPGGSPSAVGRLTMLRRAVDDAMIDTVKREVEFERTAVERGMMKPEDTLEQRLEANLRTENSEIRAAQARVGQGDGAGIPAQPSPTGEAGAIPSEYGAQGAVGGRSGSSAGDQGVSPSSTPAPLIDEAARRQLADANAATRERVETFDKGPVGEITQEVGTAGNYRTTNAMVGPKIFRPGKNGGERVKAFIKAVGPEAAEERVAPYAALDAYRSAVKPDGTIDAQKLGNWIVRHADALAPLPGVQRRLATIEGLENEVAKAAVQKRESVNAAQKQAADDAIAAKQAVADAQAASRTAQRQGAADIASTEAKGNLLTERRAAAGKDFDAADRDLAKMRQDAQTEARKVPGEPLLGAQSARTVDVAVGDVFSSPKTSAAKVGKMVDMLRGNKPAMDGLRRATVEWILSKVSTTAEAGTSGINQISGAAMQKLLRDHGDALGHLFTQRELTMMGRIGEDLRNAKRALDAHRIPGGSDTAQKTAALHGLETNNTLVRQLVHGVVGTAGGAAVLTPVLAPLGTAAGLVLSHLRNAGLSRVNDILVDAMLDPDLALQLLKRVPPPTAKDQLGRMGRDLSQALARMSVIGTREAAKAEDRNKPAAAPPKKKPTPGSSGTPAAPAGNIHGAPLMLDVRPRREPMGLPEAISAQSGDKAGPETRGLPEALRR